MFYCDIQEYIPNRQMWGHSVQHRDLMKPISRQLYGMVGDTDEPALQNGFGNNTSSLSRLKADRSSVSWMSHNTDVLTGIFN